MKYDITLEEFAKANGLPFESFNDVADAYDLVISQGHEVLSYISGNDAIMVVKYGYRPPIRLLQKEDLAPFTDEERVQMFFILHKGGDPGAIWDAVAEFARSKHLRGLPSEVLTLFIKEQMQKRNQTKEP